jgi:hypothetical protein
MRKVAHQKAYVAIARKLLATPPSPQQPVTAILETGFTVELWIHLGMGGLLTVEPCEPSIKGAAVGARLIPPIELDVLADWICGLIESVYLNLGFNEPLLREPDRPNCEYCNNTRESQKWNRETKMMETMPNACPRCCDVG